MRVPCARALVAQQQLAGAPTDHARVRIAVGAHPALHIGVGRRVQALPVEALAARRAGAACQVGGLAPAHGTHVGRAVQLIA